MSARPLFTAAFTLVLAAALAPAAHAGRTGCADEPERCVKRTASPSAATSTIVAAQVSAPTPAPVIARTKPTTAKAAGTRTTPRHVERAAHRAPSAPATPGMGTLLKVTTGTAGDISARADDGATILS